MEIRWNRIFLVIMLLLLTIGALKLYQNADAVSGKWHHLNVWMSNLFDRDPIHAGLYLILFFEIAIIVLWLLSRVVNWFRKQD